MIFLRTSLFLLITVYCVAQVHGQRATQNIDFAWKYHAGDVAGAQTPGFDDSGWTETDVPHDWSIEQAYDKNAADKGRGGYLPAGIVVYRKTFDLPDNWTNRKVAVEFDSVFMDSTVWINGQMLGNRPYGYITFAYDMTPHLKPTGNVLVVRVDNTPQPANRWYTGTGIFGHVNLLATEDVHVKRGGLFFQTISADESAATVQIETEVAGDLSATVTSQLLSGDGDVVAEDTATAADGKLTQTIDVTNPQRWSVDHPHLYTLRTTVRSGNIVKDRLDRTVGIRSLTFDRHKGFFLNDVPMKMKGVCEHHDGGPVGGAFPKKILRERLELLKQMGCNAIRAAHNPRTQDFYDLCDELGIMVMDEIFDGWHLKAEADYGGRFFDQWWKVDVEQWVRTNRNHPCVVMYSIGNETGEKDSNDISGFIKTLDTTRPTTGGTVFEGVDIQGYNGPGGEPGSMQRFHERFPDEICVRTEVPHTLQTRGFYRVRTWWRDLAKPRNLFPEYGSEQIFFDGHPRYSSSYDNCGVRISARTSWRETRDMPWIIGEFRWTGFDYIGEASFGGGKWPARIWNFGIIDLAGLPKDLYWFYQSQWTDQPMVHVLPHWSHRFLAAGTIVPVVAYSNCEEVELFLNGSSLGRTSEDPKWLEFLWKVPYAAGELKAVGYRGGQPVAEKIWNTAGAPVSLKLESNNSQLRADRRDTATITFEARDARGNNVPWSMNRVEFDIEGPVKHLGFENGDPVDVTPHRIDHRKLFYGYSRGFFQSTNQGGPIRVTAASILGDTLFESSETVAIDVQQIMLRGRLTEPRFEIRYSTDGSDALNGKPYRQPFTITDSATVNAVVIRDGKPLLNLKQQFTKGEKPKVTDPRWQPGYSDQRWTLTATGYIGPRDKELIGVWTHGEDRYDFRSDGKLYQSSTDRREQAIGYWVYDFPNDKFEAGPKDTGKGQINWLSSMGGVAPLRLTSQAAKELIVGRGKKKRKFVRLAE